MEEKITFCRLCESLCGLIAKVEGDNVVSIEPDPEQPITQGFACPKGLALHEVTHSEDRILHPLRKKPDGGFERIDWDTAIKEVGERMRTLRSEHGVDSLGFYVGNPAGFSYSAYAAAKGMSDALGTPHFYSTGSQDTAPRWVASAWLYGSILTWPTPDMRHTDLIFVLGANPVVSHGSLMGSIKAREAMVDIVDRGGRVVVIDPRRTETAKLFEHVPILPNGDVYLLAGMLNVIFGEGLEDLGALADLTLGLEDLKQAVIPYTPDVAARHSGVAAQTIVDLAHDLAAAERAVVYGRMGTCVSGFGELTTFLLDALNVVTGNLDTRGGLIFGNPPVDLPRQLIDFGVDSFGTKRSRIGGFRDILGSMPSGILADEINTPGEGQLRAMIVVAGNPLSTIPETDRIKSAMDKLDLLVSLDFNFNDYNVDADYILPVTTMLEREDGPPAVGVLQQRPFIQWTDAVIPPRGEARQEWEIIRDLSAELDIVPHMIPAIRRLGRFGRNLSPRTTFNLALRMGSAGDKFGFKRGGLNLRKLKANPHGLVVADRCPVGVLQEKITHQDKRLHLYCDDVRSEFERLAAESTKGDDQEYPFRLFGRRELRGINSWMKNAQKLRVGEPGPHGTIHPDDARKLGLGIGDVGIIRSRWGSIRLQFDVSDDIMPGTVCVPHGWSKFTPKDQGARTLHFNVNDVTTANPDTISPVGGVSLLNNVPVQIEAVVDLEEAVH